MDRADTPSLFVGVDIASESLAVAVTSGLGRLVAAPITTANDPDGFAALEVHLAAHGAVPERTLVCMEATGVYGEALCYWLHGRGYRVVVGDPATIRHRAMPVAGPKTAARYLDELRPWSPAEAVVEEVQTLLAMREQARGAEPSSARSTRSGTPSTSSGASTTRPRWPSASPRTPWATSRRGSGRSTRRSAASSASTRRSARPSPSSSACRGWGTSSPPTSPWPRAGSPGRSRGSGSPPTPGSPEPVPERDERGAPLEEPGVRAVDGAEAAVHGVAGAGTDGGAVRVVLPAEVGEGKSGRLVVNNLSNKLVRVMAAVLREGVPYEAGRVSGRPAIQWLCPLTSS